jgi:hypothetical protein
VLFAYPKKVKSQVFELPMTLTASTKRKGIRAPKSNPQWKGDYDKKS